MMPRLRLLLVAGSAMLLVGLIGCGSSDSEESLTKAQYVQQADKICEKTEGRQEALLLKATKKGANAEGSQELVRVVREAAIPPLHQQVEELEGLGKPETGAEEIDAFVAEFEKAIEEIEKDPAALNSEPTPFTDAEKMAQKLGLKICGGP